MRTTIEDRSPPLATTARFANPDRHMKLHRLLVPVDFTTATLPALRFAGALAEKFASTIHLLHVIEDHPTAMGEAAAADDHHDRRLAGHLCSPC